MLRIRCLPETALIKMIDFKINKFKNYLRSSIHPYIYLLFKKYYYFFKNNKAAINNLDLKLEKYLNFNNGYFVELGGNDGISQSNTYFLEKNKNWKGVLIEPNPFLYHFCFHFRKNKGLNKLFCNAVVSNKYQDEFVKIITNDSAGLTAKVSAKKIKKHLPSSYNTSINNLYFAAEARTLDKILSISNSPHIIDFLSIDVEGYELEVLKGINFRKYKFKYLLLETKSHELITKFLTKKNYSFVQKITHHDFLFKYDFS